MTYRGAYFGLGLAFVILMSLLLSNAAGKLVDELGEHLRHDRADTNRAPVAGDLKSSFHSRGDTP